MTSLLNLPAPGRCQSIYVVFTTLHRHEFLLNSRLAHFSAALIRGHPLSRSYGVNLPSSLTTAHSSALEYSSHLPVSVCGTVALVYAGAFLGSMIRESLQACAIPFGFHLATTPLDRHPTDGSPFTSASLRFKFRQYRNINLLSITYAFRPRLRTRLTLRRLTLLRKP